MTDAPIEIVAHDPRWAELFIVERDAITAHLARWLTGAPEHIGSTAVPGLRAKPIIDIMAPVASLASSRAVIAAAQRLGYVHFPYQPDVMHWFCKPGPAHRTHHLHLVSADGRTWFDRLCFRDALREDDSLRDAYAALKQSLAENHRNDRDAYTAAKGPFIEAVIQSGRRKVARSVPPV